MTTKIEWTNETWNPVRGCAIVSKGCTNCYAMKQARRHSGPGGAYEGLTQPAKGGPVWTGKVRTVPDLLDAPLHWKRPRRVFVNSMSDLFHEDVDAVFIGSVFGIAAACPQHTFQILTKRPARMLEMLRSLAFLDAYESSFEMYSHAQAPWPAPNIHLGVSVEDQPSADERIPQLIEAPAAVRWISAEPLLGPVNIRRIFWKSTSNAEIFIDAASPEYHGPGSCRLDWVVAGGESGPGARPSHPDWFRLLRDQCAAAGVPFFFKQWGDWAEAPICSFGKEPSRTRFRFVPAARLGGNGAHMFRYGKTGSGRVLDGCVHDEYPA